MAANQYRRFEDFFAAFFAFLAGFFAAFFFTVGLKLADTRTPDPVATLAGRALSLGLRLEDPEEPEPEDLLLREGSLASMSISGPAGSPYTRL